MHVEKCSILSFFFIIAIIISKPQLWNDMCLGVVFKVLWSRISQGLGLLLSKQKDRNIVTIHREDVILSNYISKRMNTVVSSWTVHSSAIIH